MFLETRRNLKNQQTGTLAKPSSSQFCPRAQTLPTIKTRAHEGTLGVMNLGSLTAIKVRSFPRGINTNHSTRPRVCVKVFPAGAFGKLRASLLKFRGTRTFFMHPLRLDDSEIRGSGRIPSAMVPGHNHPSRANFSHSMSTKVSNARVISGQRVFGVPSQANDSNTCIKGIVKKQPSHKTRAER